MTNFTMTSSHGHPSRSMSRQNVTPSRNNLESQESSDHDIYQTLLSLALLCLPSLLMSFLALFFLQKISPLTLTISNGKSFNSDSPNKIIMGGGEFFVVYQVSVALSTLSISLNLCCLFVCSIQFLFAISLMKTVHNDERTEKF
ncbi:uncharacterized protein LOC106466249 [Limulus polyphemus]|uniref:Uncharacterized protein LOC106466249 n=1 Tax=Limulus polyphemus TaxID=6850 RepID=A0ABM1BH91_LIMPO|nr:uncharacterized protein LOC106466249 [Limulus polyphemus]